jgi:hypothetical protein
MKVYQLVQADIDRLRLMLRENPKQGIGITEPERVVHDDTFRWFNYRIETWLNEVTK